tara:strand:- start:394 stop:579 length:186 start_codon:yes stop_codon:yes gene_type:complete
MKEYKTKKEIQDEINEIDRELAEMNAKHNLDPKSGTINKTGCLGTLIVAFISTLFIFQKTF